MLRKGQTDQQVLDYMTARYGDFVLYRPPVKTTTWPLWFGPAVLLVVGVAVFVVVIRRRTRMAPEAFEPDPDEKA
jgi:cytochrome c-type biogenesis protein CcmH